jgi:hypothetical protein
VNKNRRKEDIVSALDPLSARQARTIRALLSESTIEGAAKAAGVSRAIIYVWEKEPAFATALREARDAAFRSGLDELRAATSKAVRVLAGLLEAKREETRRLAATTILGLGLKGHEIIEIEERLRRLEDIAKKRSSFRPN